MDRDLISYVELSVSYALLDKCDWPPELRPTAKQAAEMARAIRECLEGAGYKIERPPLREEADSEMG